MNDETTVMQTHEAGASAACLPHLR